MKDEVVTQKVLAEELHAAPSSISHLVARGMPRRKDKKLNRVECLRWITSNSIGSAGGWSGQMRDKLSLNERARALLAGTDGQGDQEQEPLDPSLAGAATACILFCSNIREVFPEMFADTDTLPNWSVTAQLLSVKARALAVVDFLMRGWCEEVFTALAERGYPVELPAIDWSPFGKHADCARKMFEVQQAVWDGSDPGEGVIELPDDDPVVAPKPRKDRAKRK